jgi:hypothetical protein
VVKIAFIVNLLDLFILMTHTTPTLVSHDIAFTGDIDPIPAHVVAPDVGLRADVLFQPLDQHLKTKGCSTISYRCTMVGHRNEDPSWGVITFKPTPVNGISSVLQEFQQVPLLVVPRNSAITISFSEIDVPGILLTGGLHHDVQQFFTTLCKLLVHARMVILRALRHLQFLSLPIV